jgi:pyruvate/2-oxoglutarate/acetoin dehydrogenase E1 component
MSRVAALSGGRTGVSRVPDANSPLTMVEALNLALMEEMESDPNVVLLGEDVGVTGGVFRVSAGLQERFGTERVIDTPASEAGYVGAAVGLCLAGLRPVVEVQFDSFVYPAFEQIACHLSRYQWRTAGAVSMPATLRVPYGGGTHAPELHSDSPEALFCHLPGLIVVTPSSPGDAYRLLRWAIRHPNPVVFMEPKRLYRSMREKVSDDPEPEGIPSARVLREGSDVSLVSYGASIPYCLEAASELANEGVSVEVVDLRVLWPLDKASILASVGKTGRCVVVHEAPRSCGVGAEVAAVLAQEALFSLQAPIVRVAGQDAPFPMFSLEQEYLPVPEKIVSALQEVLSA